MLRWREPSRSVSAQACETAGIAVRVDIRYRTQSPEGTLRLLSLWHWPRHRASRGRTRAARARARPAAQSRVGRVDVLVHIIGVTERATAGRRYSCGVRVALSRLAECRSTGSSRSELRIRRRRCPMTGHRRPIWPTTCCGPDRPPFASRRGWAVVIESYSTRSSTSGSSRRRSSRQPDVSARPRVGLAVAVGLSVSCGHLGAAYRGRHRDARRDPKAGYGPDPSRRRVCAPDQAGIRASSRGAAWIHTRASSSLARWQASSVQHSSRTLRLADVNAG